MDKINQWGKELKIIQSILKKTELKPAIKWGGEVYTLNGKNIVSAGGFKNHFTIWFYNGVYLKDPYQVLVSAKGENTKALRQWRFTDANQINEDQILDYVMEAIDNEKKGLSWKPQKSGPLKIPETLAICFKDNKTFKDAFEKLPPYKQKDYVEYIDMAKREETKLSRLEKIIPMIMNGIGLHDKYK